MFIQSLVSVIEAATSSSNFKSATGNIKYDETEEILKKENLQKLEAEKRIFAFISFNAANDRHVAEYVKDLKAVAEDSGKRILVLFFLDKTAFRPQTLNQDAFSKWIDFEEEDNPTHNLTLNLFGKKTPRMPGILFIEKLSAITEPIYISLEGLNSKDEVVSKMRRIFQLATESYNAALEKDDDFVKRLAILLAIDKFDYQRAEKMSVLEALIKSFNYVRKNAGELVTLVKVFKP